MSSVLIDSSGSQGKMEEPRGRSLKSRLQLSFGHDEDRGFTQITERFHQGLFHISKQYQLGEQILVQLVNPTAGLFAGDHFSANIRLARGASACISSPSATQVHTMRDGGYASGQQVIEVAEGATLEYLPNLIVPRLHSNLNVHTKIRLAETAALYYVDILSPGRKAHGESLVFDSLRLKTEVFCEERLLMREILSMTSDFDKKRWGILKNAEQAPYIATIYLHHPEWDETQFDLGVIEQLGNQNTHIGATFVDTHLCLVRLAAPSLVDIKKTLRAIRSLVRTIFKLSETRI
jgi:urease accessory protein